MEHLAKEIADLKVANGKIATALTDLSEAVTSAAQTIKDQVMQLALYANVDPDPNGVIEGEVSKMNDAATTLGALATTLRGGSPAPAPVAAPPAAPAPAPPVAPDAPPANPVPADGDPNQSTGTGN